MNRPTFLPSCAAQALWRGLALLALALLPLLGHAQTDAGRPNYSAGDWALLPEWCIDTQDGPYGSPSYSDTPVGKNQSPRSLRWTSIFGGDFWHMHHFCRALYSERKLQMTVGAPQRISLAKIILGEYSYLVHKCSPSNPMMPEVLVRMGDIQLKSDDRIAAMGSYESARALKPDYWPAYTRWVDELIKLGLFSKARELVDQGLAQMPDEPNLLQRRKALEGKS